MLADVSVQCYVLSDKRRMLSQSGLLTAMGRARGFPNSTTKGLPAFLSLPVVCQVYLDAHAAGALYPSQLHIAERAEVLLGAVAVVGIIGLIDEATGYEKYRPHRALAKILELWLVDKYKPWARTFPFEFYQEIWERPTTCCVGVLNA